MKIWGRANSINVMKVLWCADECGLKYEREDVGGAFGAPSHRAPAWAALADRAYYLLRLSGGYIQGCVAEDALAAFSRGGDEPSELVIEYARMLRLRAAVEAVLLWSADPLPVADIEYAAGIAIGRF